MIELAQRDIRVWQHIVQFKDENEDSPSVRDIAGALNISTATVQKAMDILIATGKIQCPMRNKRRSPRSIKVLQRPEEYNLASQV